MPRTVPLAIRFAAVAAALVAMALGCSKRAPKQDRAPRQAQDAAAQPPQPAPADAASDDLLERCRAASAYALEHEGDFVLVMLDGKVVFEEGRAPYGAQSLHLLASGTKSFCGVAAALAVQDGFLRLDEPVSDTITEWRDDPRKQAVTVRQLLSLASGLESLSATIDSERSAAAAGITDRAKASIEARSVAAPGTRFIYGPSSFYVFGELMKRKLAAQPERDADMAAYLDRRLFAPLGISLHLFRDPAGNANVAGGGRVSAEDWAIFGEFMRNEGRHDGRALADPAVLAELLRPHGPNPRYGLTWWLLRDDPAAGDPEDEVAAGLVADRLEADAQAGGASGGLRDRLARVARESQAREAARSQQAAQSAIRGFMAAGKGKQRLYVLPAERMVVVRFGAIDGGRAFRDAEFLRILVPVASPR